MTDRAAGADVVPVAFLLDAVGPLALPGQASGGALWHELTHRVMRRPAALGEHVRRVALCRRDGFRARAAGALADLLHVLDGRGEALAARLFASIADVIDPADRALLDDWLAGRVPPPARVHALAGSVLPTLPALLGSASTLATSSTSATPVATP